MVFYASAPLSPKKNSLQFCYVWKEGGWALEPCGCGGEATRFAVLFPFADIAISFME
jgi:hypothetical protein